MTTLASLCGGRVYKTQVPDDVTLDGIKPHIVVRFHRPLATTQGRNVGSGEKGQPHMLTGTIIVASGDANSTETTLDEAEDLLVGEQPSPTASVITLRGGQSFPQGDTDSRPTTFVAATFFRFYINV